VEFGAGALVCGEVVGGQDHSLARETVAQGIERCAAFPSGVTDPEEWTALRRLISA
jgi:hypothetical protein